MSTTSEEIIEIVAKRAKRGFSTVTESDDLYEDLWISTDDFAEIAYEIQEKFGESIPVDDFRSGSISKVGDIVDRVKGQTWADSHSSCDDDFSDDVPTNNGGYDLPAELKRWNWGACLLGWIWGIFNGVYKMSLLLFLLSLIPFGNILAIIIYGKKGNEWAWKEKSWASMDEFMRVQRKWTVAGIWFSVIYAIIILIFLLMEG